MSQERGLHLHAGRVETKGTSEELDAAGESGGAWHWQLLPEAAAALVAGRFMAVLVAQRRGKNERFENGKDGAYDWS